MLPLHYKSNAGSLYRNAAVAGVAVKSWACRSNASRSFGQIHHWRPSLNAGITPVSHQKRIVRSGTPRRLATVEPRTGRSHGPKSEEVFDVLPMSQDSLQVMGQRAKSNKRLPATPVNRLGVILEAQIVPAVATGALVFLIVLAFQGVSETCPSSTTLLIVLSFLKVLETGPSSLR